MVGFNYKKSVQALNFFAIKEGGAINKMKALKLIWLADRHHLRRYARPILNDIYIAMQRGPVASNTKDFIEDNSYVSKIESNYRNAYIQTSQDVKHTFTSLQSVDDSIFSQTDLEVMESVYQRYGNLDKWRLSELSHQFPEWKRFEQALKNENKSRFEMDYKDFFQSASDTDDLEVDEEIVALSKEIYLEELAIAEIA